MLGLQAFPPIKIKYSQSVDTYLFIYIHISLCTTKGFFSQGGVGGLVILGAGGVSKFNSDRLAAEYWIAVREGALNPKP